MNIKNVLRFLLLNRRYTIFTIGQRSWVLANLLGYTQNRVLVYSCRTPVRLSKETYQKFSGQKSLGIGAFIRNLSNIIPVFDKGIIRNQINFTT